MVAPRLILIVEQQSADFGLGAQQSQEHWRDEAHLQTFRLAVSCEVAEVRQHERNPIERAGFSAPELRVGCADGKRAELWQRFLEDDQPIGIQVDNGLKATTSTLKIAVVPPMPMAASGSP